MVDPGVVDHVVGLARLALGGDERARLAGEISTLLQHMAVLDKVQTTGVPPTSHPLDLANVTEPDVVRPGLPREAALRNAPLCEEDRYYRVPPVIDGNRTCRSG